MTFEKSQLEIFFTNNVQCNCQFAKGSFQLLLLKEAICMEPHRHWKKLEIYDNMQGPVIREEKEVDLMEIVREVGPCPKNITAGGFNSKWNIEFMADN